MPTKRVDREKWYIHTTPEGFKKIFVEFLGFKEFARREITCADKRTRDLVEIDIVYLRQILRMEYSIEVKFDVYTNEGYGVRPADKDKIRGPVVEVSVEVSKADVIRRALKKFKEVKDSQATKN